METMNWKLAGSILAKKVFAVPLLWASQILRSFAPVEQVTLLDAAAPLINLLGWALLIAGGYLALTALPALFWVGRTSAAWAWQHSQAARTHTGAITALAAREIGSVIGLILKIMFWPLMMLFRVLAYGAQGIIWLIGKGLSFLWRAIVFVLRPAVLALALVGRGLSATARLVGRGIVSLPGPVWWLIAAAVCGAGLLWLGQVWPPLWFVLGSAVAIFVLAMVLALLVNGFKLLWRAIVRTLSPFGLLLATLWRGIMRFVGLLISVLTWPIVMLAKLVGWLFGGLKSGLAFVARPFARVHHVLVGGLRLIGRGLAAGLSLLIGALAAVSLLLAGGVALIWKGTIWLFAHFLLTIATGWRGLRQLALPIGRGLRRLWRAVVWVMRLLITVLAWPIVILAKLLRWLFGGLKSGLALWASPVRWIGRGLRRLWHAIVWIVRLLMTVLIWPIVMLAKLVGWLFDSLSRGLALLARPFIWAGRKLSSGMCVLGGWAASALRGIERVMTLRIDWVGGVIMKTMRGLARGVSALFAPMTIIFRRVIMRKEAVWMLVGVSSMMLIAVYYLASCSAQAATPVSDLAADPNTFRIVAEHDVRNLEEAGLFEQFTKETGVQLTVTYRGPVDIRDAVSQTSKNNPKTVDAFWPASTLWLSGSSTVSPETVMKSYIVLAVDPDTAAELGWAAGQRIAATDLVGAVQAGKVKLAMTSATQSTSGAVFFLAMYTALSGKPVLTTADLKNPATLEALKTLLNGIDRSAAEVDHLKDVFVEDKVSGKRATNAIVIYESLAIQMNQELVAKGQNPMLVFYVEGATAIADAPLRYVDNGDDQKLAQYHQLVEFLQREAIVKRIQALGWRTNQIGMGVDNPDLAVFNPAWGVDTKTEFQEMIFPKLPATRAALDWYQVYGRKPSFTVYCLDFSTSMAENKGNPQMVDAMDLLLDQNRAAAILLQATESDVTVIYAFSGTVTQVGAQVTGNDPAILKQLSHQIKSQPLASSTAMFDCLESALVYINNHYDPGIYAYSVIAMTDGGSNTGATAADFITFYQQGGYTVPVYGIAFGSPDFNQLNELAKTGGAVYDGRQDIALAFRAAKGNN